MRQDPSWNGMARYAHTCAHEGRILRGLMDGKPLPADRWSIDALAALLPKVTVLTLPGQDHGAFWAAPEPVTEQIREFLLSRPGAG